MSTIPETEIDDPNDVDFKPNVDLKTLKLPPIMLGRVNAVKNLQLSNLKEETEYYREVHLLDAKFQAQFDEIYKQRAKVISGDHEPSGAELEWPDEKEVDVEGDLAKKVEGMTLHPDFPADAKGLPKFWLHAFKNANEECLAGLIEPHDEPVLEYLSDITVAWHPNGTGFTLSFHFNENPYFTNKVLTKEYFLRDGPDPESPLLYDGPEIIGCKGCFVAWKDGMDVTVTSVSIGWKESVSVIEGSETGPKVIETGSFFTFFDPPEGDCPDVDDKKALSADYDLGFAIKEKIIPRAVLYFTGEIRGDEDDCGEDDPEEDCIHTNEDEVKAT